VSSNSSGDMIDHGQQFVLQFVEPFYVGSFGTNEFATQFFSIQEQVDSSVVNRLLKSNDWRFRIVGSYFSAIKNYSENVFVIGGYLLKSEFVFANRGYILALASFNCDEARMFVFRYLESVRVLTDYDDSPLYALAAAFFLDRRNGTSFFAGALSSSIAIDRQDFRVVSDRFESDMEFILNLQLESRG
jgi:hypothetical protein